MLSDKISRQKAHNRDQADERRRLTAAIMRCVSRPNKCVRYNRSNQKSAARQQIPKASDHELRHHSSSPACSDA